MIIDYLYSIRITFPQHPYHDQKMLQYMFLYDGILLPFSQFFNCNSILVSLPNNDIKIIIDDILIDSKSIHKIMHNIIQINLGSGKSRS